MTDIKIRAASEVGITSAKKDMIYNDYKGTVGLRHTTYEAVNNTLTPLSALNNQQMHFDLPTGQSAINIPESYVKIQMRLKYHFNKPGVAKMINGIWYHTDYTVATGADVLTPPEQVAATAVAPQPYAVSTAPLCAMQLLDSSDVSYNGMKIHTYDIGRKINYFLAKVQRAHAENQKMTWFMGSGYDNAAIEIDGRPYFMDAGVKKYLGTTKWVVATALTQPAIAPEFDTSITASYPTNFCVSKIINLQVPLSFMSDVFLQEDNLFYTNAVNQAWFQLYFRFNRNNIAKVMGRAGNFGAGTTALTDVGLISGTPATDTAITAITLEVYEKASNLFTSDLAQDKVIPSRTLGCAVQRMSGFGTSATDYGNRTYTNSEGKKSVNDIMVLVSPDDEADNDSCFIHGFSTTYKAAEIVKIINEKALSPTYAFFYDFNITLPTTGDLLFQPQGIRNLAQFKNVSMASLNLLSNFYATPNPLWAGNYWNMFQSVIIINCEGFKNDFAKDVILDGVSTESKGATFRLEIRKYDPSPLTFGETNPVEPQAANKTATGYQTLGALLTDCYYFYDAWNVIIPSQNKMIFTEDIEKFM